MALKSYPVSSSAIARIEYDDEEEICYVSFNKPPYGPYTLSNFPQIEVERWVESESPGAYWNANLKGNY